MFAPGVVSVSAKSGVTLIPLLVETCSTPLASIRAVTPPFALNNDSMKLNRSLSVLVFVTLNDVLVTAAPAGSIPAMLITSPATKAFPLIVAGSMLISSVLALAVVVASRTGCARLLRRIS